MRLLGLSNAEALLETYGRACEAVADRTQPFDGVFDTLHALVRQGWILGVVTSKSLCRAEPLLARTGTPFATVRTPGRERGKPAPDPLLLALLDLRLDPDQAVYVGDMAVDQECARRAGVAYVHAGWGYGTPSGPDPVIAEAPYGYGPLTTAEEELLHHFAACEAATALVRGHERADPDLTQHGRAALAHLLL
jgi:phosphoglycolate phosphatase-like HAD superfamily hydrolase